MTPKRRRARTASILLLLLLTVPFVSPPSYAAVTVTGLRCWVDEEYTRVVVDLGGEASFTTGTVAADPARNLPARLFVDISGASVGEEIVNRPVEVGNGLLRVVRAGRYKKGVVRVVLDLERESAFTAVEMTDPYRIVIDVEGKSPGAPVAATDNSAPVVVTAGAENAALVPSVPPPGQEPQVAVGRRLRVMLDPGHGGKDPGAVGQSGLREKDVVLDLSRRLKARLLAAGGYDVVSTRDSDVFIPLEERTAMANRARADIFVSLHINASTDRRAEGISTYVLSRATDRASLELAARENGVPVAKLEGVKFIVDDLALVGRKNESMRLAKSVNDNVVRKVSSKYGTVPDLGLRQAPFYVLVGARMTAVLVESSFISNAREEKRLRESAALDAIADGVSDGIRAYAGKRTRTLARATLQ